MLPKGLGGLGDIGNMMKHAMDLKSNMEELKETLANERIEAASGGGMVTVTMNGKLEILAIKIDPEIIDRGLMIDALHSSSCRKFATGLRDASIRASA